MDGVQIVDSKSIIEDSQIMRRGVDFKESPFLKILAVITSMQIMMLTEKAALSSTKVLIATKR